MIKQLKIVGLGKFTTQLGSSQSTVSLEFPENRGLPVIFSIYEWFQKHMKIQKSLVFVHLFTDTGCNICYIFGVNIDTSLNIVNQLISHSRLRVMLRIIQAF